MRQLDLKKDGNLYSILWLNLELSSANNKLVKSYLAGQSKNKAQKQSPEAVAQIR